MYCFAIARIFFSFVYSQTPQDSEAGAVFPTKKSKMDNQDNQAMSHKGEQRRKFSMEFKKNVIKYAEENSLNSASKKFNFDRKRVRE